MAQREAYERERAVVSEVLSAAAAGDVARLQAAADGSQVLGFRDANARGVLHFAAAGDRVALLQAVQEMVSTEEWQAALEAEDAMGDTPLRLALRGGNVAAARWLGGQAAPPAESKEDLKAKPALLHVAASSGNAEVVRLVLEELGGAAEVNRRAEVGTPLFWAAFNASGAVAELLIAAGADVNARDAEGLSPLLVAVTRDAPEVAAALLAAGAKLEVDTEREGATTVLHAGAAAGSLAALETVLAKAPEDAVRAALQAKPNGLTAAELAAYGAHRETAQRLLAFAGDAEDVDALMKRMAAQRDADEGSGERDVTESSEQCQEFKARANALFKEGKAEEALEQYTAAVDAAEALLARAETQAARLCSTQAAARVELVKRELLAVLLANRSACQLKLGGKDGAASARADAQRVTELDPKRAKGFFRLGMACSALGEHADAAQAFWSGYELDPKADGAKTLLALFQREVKAGKEEEAARNGTAPPPEAPRAFEHNLPVEIPQDSSPNAPLRSLTLSFNSGEAPSMVAGRFIQANNLDPSLLPRIAHHVNDFMASNH